LGKDGKDVALPVFAGDNEILIQNRPFVLRSEGFFKMVGQEILPERFDP